MNAAPRKPKPERKTALLLRLEPADIKLLDELAERVPWASRTSLAIAAMRIGLVEIEDDPTRLVGKK